MIRLAAAALLALTASADRNERDDLIGTRVAGAPVNCAPLSPGGSNGLFIVDRETIGLRQGASKLYLTKPIGTCPSLRPLSTLIVDVRSGSQVCRNDRFQVLEAGTSIPSAYCRFDRFTPYTRR